MTHDNQLSSFYVHGLYMGIPVQAVQEVLHQLEITRVPLSPPRVTGLVNLRGQILTAIDLRTCLHFPPRPHDQVPVHMIVRSENALVSVLIDEIDDVVEPGLAIFENSPATIQGQVGQYVHGAYKLPGKLLWYLNIEALLGDFSPYDTNLQLST